MSTFVLEITMKWFCIIALMISSVAHSAQLSATNGVKLLLVNGKDVNKYQAGDHSGVALDEGKYQVVIRFDKIVRRGSKNFRYVSDPHILDLAIDKQNLILSVPIIRTINHADAFFRAPKWQIINDVAKTTQKLEGLPLNGKGFGVYSDIEKSMAIYNKEKNIHFDNGAEIPLLLDKKTSDVNKVSAKENTPLSQLKYWYNKASDQQKKAFESWLDKKAL